MAIVIACAMAIWGFNGYFDQIYWNFLAALCCSVLCVCSYLRHQQEPGNGGWLALALVLWLLAISTYTIQIGAAAAIACLAFLRGVSDRAGGWPLRLAAGARAALEAVWPFAAVLVLFVLIWRTTAAPADAFVQAPTLQRLVASLRMGLWHEDFDLMRAMLMLSPHRRAYVLACVVVGAVTMAILARSAAENPPWRKILVLLMVAGCLAVPTVMVETLGAQWAPGSRWRMIYQFFTPVLFVSVLLLVVSRLPQFLGRPAWVGGLALLFAAIALGSLVHNERQVLLARNEQALRRAILEDAAQQRTGGDRTIHYLVLLDEGTRWFASDRLSPVYAKSWFRNQAITFRLVPSPLYAPLQPDPAIVFLDDREGVAHVVPGGAPVSYAQVRVVAGNRGTFSVKQEVTERDLAGFRAEWRRTGAVRLGS